MKSPILTLHDAIFDRLKGGTSWRIYDSVPAREEFPYISMGLITGRPWIDKSQDGQEVFATLDFWSQYKGKAEVVGMMANVLEVITASDLALGSTFRAALSALDLNEVLDGIDGVTRHGVLRLKFLIEEL